MLRRLLQAALVTGWLLAASTASLAQELLGVPPLSGRVIDTTNTLSAAQREALSGKLAAFESSNGTQVVVLLVKSTQPEEIAAYAQRVADAWKIGRREVGDGLLVVVARDDRRLRIEVAKSLEGAVPDLAARRIIEQHIAPAFKAGDYAGGLNAGVDALLQRVRGESLPVPQARGNAPDLGAVSGWQDLAIFFFVGVPVVGAVLTSLFGRKFGSVLTGGAAGGMGWWFTASKVLAVGAGLLAVLLVGLLGIGAARGRRGGGTPVVWGGGGGGWSGGGGGGGGGGFSSGGGGDFGGGGASGDW